MGTRSLTYVYDGDSIVLCMYRQMDGYPSGHGQELYEFLKDGKLVNGLGITSEKVFNGAGCMAAQLVAHFKKDAGGFYLYPSKPRIQDAWQEFEYEIHVDSAARLVIRVIDCAKRVKKKGSDSGTIFLGTLEEFGKFTGAIEDEVITTSKSWKPVFRMPNDPVWYDNAQRYASKEEAMASASARFSVWTMPEAYDAIESTDPVNYMWVEGTGDVMINRRAA